MIAALAIYREESLRFVGAFEECVQLNAVVAIEATAARLPLKARRLLRGGLDVDADVG